MQRCTRAPLHVFAFLAVGTAFGQQYAVTDLGTLGPDADFTVPTDMNNLGEVVGNSFVYDNGQKTLSFFWTCGQMTPVPEPQGAWYVHARAINDAGQIAGDATTFDYVTSAYLWSGTEITPLGSLGTGETLAWGINNHGHVVGWSVVDTNPPTTHGFMWDGELHEILPLTGVYIDPSDAADINNAGVIAGGSVAIINGERDGGAVMWIDNDGIPLRPLPGDTGSEAIRINNSNAVAGISSLNSARNFAVLWREGEIIPITPFIPDNPQNFRSSEATDINDYDEVSGWGVRNGGGGNSNEGFIWREGQLTFMSSLTPPDFEWRLQPMAINNAGQVACRARFRPDPFGVPMRAYILTPPECRGFPRGDANCDGLVNNFDIDAFVLALSNVDQYAADYAACNWLCNLDINRDGLVNNFDIDPLVMLLAGG